MDIKFWDWLHRVGVHGKVSQNQLFFWTPSGSKNDINFSAGAENDNSSFSNLINSTLMFKSTFEIHKHQKWNEA